MKLRFAILGAVGVALALYLVRYVGWHAVLAAAAAIGWSGFFVFCLSALALFILLGAAWQVLFPAGTAPSLALLVRARLVRDAGAEVLPLSQLGGIALGVRAAVLQGVAAPLAAASMIVDVTTEMLAQIAYAAGGMVILAARVPHSSHVASIISGCAIGLGLSILAAVLFIALQRHGGRVSARLARSLMRGGGQKLTGLTAALETIHRSAARVALSTLLHLAAWIGNAVAVWLGFRLIGARLDLLAAIAIESLVYAIRSAAVFIPNALGVQEGAYMLLAPLFGVGTETALAISVLKRARDVVIGVPVLLIWQAAEGRRALGSGAAHPQAGDGHAQ
ncbi:MAG: flippase-like domain-containing protein [Gammaproteobacteria bacterium]|nr:flippase-like domain-containing protein [Gammaproteobacteria bacterium]MBV8403625.1 flippase-like domain-containing protein [Gammaproteobacteria bacterium]